MMLPNGIPWPVKTRLSTTRVRLCEISKQIPKQTPDNNCPIDLSTSFTCKLYFAKHTLRRVIMGY